MTASEGASLPLQPIDSAVTSAGFTPRGMRATAGGTLRAEGPGWTLSLGEGRGAIRLAEGEAFARLEGVGAAKVRISGPIEWERPGGGRAAVPSLVVDALEIARDGP